MASGKMELKIVYCCLLLFLPQLKSLRAAISDTDLNELSEQQNGIKISKCCEENELKIDSKCRVAANYDQQLWIPKFKDEDGKDVKVKYYSYVEGIPDCETTQQRPIFDLGDSEDELQLLSDGRLRHLIHHEHKSDNIFENTHINPIYGLHESIQIPEEREPNSYIHMQGKYCMDKIFMTKTNKTGEYALVCIPEVKINWADTDFLMKKILNPLFHGLAILFYLLVAIIYFVLPTLRDLAGNIITTINVCLIFSQAADLVRIFTEFSNHVSFFIVDTAVCISLLSAFFWLNSFGFYIWKTFKSRNVFLRVTDVRKYCYYSCVVWSGTATMAVLALTAHWLLDTNKNQYKKRQSSFFTDETEQDTIGWLGIAIFFTPVAFTIIFNIFFYVTTLKVIKRINIYGRIHYKLKGCFDLFMQLFLIMTIGWLFLLLSWLQFDGLVYAHVVVNLLQAILMFYVCVLRQSHVTFLLRKSCCYAQPIPTGEWGDEMTHMNGNCYN